MKWLNTLSFQHHIFLGFLIVALIPLTLCSFLMVNVYTLTLKHQMVTDGNQQIKELTNRLSVLFESQNESRTILLQDDLTARVLIDNRTDEYPKELYMALYQVKSSLPTQISFTIYDAGGHQRFSTDPDTSQDVLPIYWGVLYKARHSDASVYYATDPTLNGTSMALMQTAHYVENSSGSRVGYLVMGMTQKNLDLLFESFYSEQDTLLITDSHRNLIYTSNNKYKNATLSMIKNHETDPRFWYTYATEPTSGFNIILQKSSAISTSTGKTMKRISLITGFLCLSLCLILSLHLGRRLAKPIRRLNRAMEQVKNGDLSVYVSTSRKDELGELTENFNYMTGDLKEYVAKLIQRQKDLNDTKLSLYQTQLNPHFLYNTLDSIKWSAKIHEIQEIASMAENLADILRKSISGNQFIPLKQELETIDNYLNIQRIRYLGKFVYEAEIPPQLEDCIVPKLLLQPLVENAILHGLADRKTGSILIYADQIGPNIHICVTDDGCGMSQDIIDWINAPIAVEREGHLGLYNINNIIKIYYGSEYGLTADVDPGIGTTVTIVLPLKKENMYD